MTSFLIPAVLGLAGLIAAIVSMSSVVYMKLAGGGWRVWDASPRSNAAREVLAHVCAALAPALVPIALCWLSIGVGGQPVPTNALPDSDWLEIEGARFQVLSLSRLIVVKEQLNRPKDQAMLVLLRATLDELQKRRP